MKDDYQQRAEALVARLVNTNCIDYASRDVAVRIAEEELCAAAEQAASEEREACAIFAYDYAFNGLCLSTQEANNLAYNIRHRRDPERHE